MKVPPYSLVVAGGNTFHARPASSFENRAGMSVACTRRYPTHFAENGYRHRAQETHCDGSACSLKRSTRKGPTG